MKMLDLTQQSFVLIVIKITFIDNVDQNKRNGNQEDHFFDPLLYKCRFVLERTNAWLDTFKALLMRFETNEIHWKALNIFGFSVFLLRQL
jgi:hypothetical protein